LAFITVEGIEGVGKSTCTACIDKFLTEHNIPHVMTREPGGTEIAESIRGVLLKHHTETMAPLTELLLMFASRSQHLSTLIKPALASGQWVVSDRFTDASFAYQGAGRQLPLSHLEQLEQIVHHDLQPDLTLLLDAPVEVAQARAHARSTPDRIEVEKLEFFERVRQCYLQRAKTAPQRFVIIDATQTLANVENEIRQALASLVDETQLS